MDPIALILILFALATALSLAAVRIRIPYPTAMVIAGLLIGITVYLFPRFSGFSITLKPEVLFTAILPPLLYSAAWTTSWTDFRASLRPIMLLAIGLVLFTTTGIAAIAVAFLPGFTWPLGFVLGAIVSPPDAVAATAVTKTLRIPRRIVTILDGESLVNDASALVVYRFALAVALGAAFSLSSALIQFPLVAGGGVLVGIFVAWILHQIHERIEQPMIETALTLLTPYAAYILAEHLHTSGVLAVVTCGLVLSRHSPHLFSSQTRLTVITLWAFFTFILNGIVFILIGLQLPTILRGLHTSLTQATVDAIIVCIALVLLRLLWVFPGAYLPRLLPSVRAHEQRPLPRQVFLIGWIGMRGVVSLAAALALPQNLPNGDPFPARDLILFLTFAVILVTLVVQSLSLESVIKALHVEAPEEDGCAEAELHRRLTIAALDEIAAHPPSHAADTLRSLYTHRLEHLRSCEEMSNGPDPENTLHQSILRTQRKLIADLRDNGQITDDLLRKAEHELDLEESRIPL